MKKSSCFLAASLLPLLFAACDTKEGTTVAGGSDDIDTRIAVDRNGSPVADVRIALVRSGDSTSEAVALTATSKDGRFPEFAVPDGYYSLVLRDLGDTIGKFVESVPISNRKIAAGRDTLLSLGAIHGFVRMTSNLSPATVGIALYGTDIITNVNPDGSFHLEMVPGGIYTLAAIPRADGYGPLYKRIQIQDGQILTLGDTLVMPYAGFPPPDGFTVSQDSVTGNVRVSWKPLSHPDLLGYEIERVENGTSSFKRFLADTTWTDSLGKYWETMPIQGPWPSRNIVYRVRSISLSGEAPSQNAAQAFTAKPPSWAKASDTVKPIYSTDSSTGAKTFTWLAPKNPDLLGWRVEQLVENNPTCRAQPASMSWNDSVCPDINELKPLEQGTGIYHPTLGIQVSYVFTTVRKSGRLDSFRLECPVATPPRVIWRDSGLSNVPSNVEMRAFGGWLLWREPGKPAKVSKDGANWEELTTEQSDTNWTITGAGDSLWLLRNGADWNHIQIQTRIGPRKWDVRTATSTQSIGAIHSAFADGNGFWFFSHDIPDPYLELQMHTVRGDSILRWEDSIQFSITGFIYDILADDKGVIFTKFNSGQTTRTGPTFGPEETIWPMYLRGYAGHVGTDGAIVMQTLTMSNSYFGLSYLGIDGVGWALPAPSGTPYWLSSAPTLFDPTVVFHDEIWTIIDGHLWKGRITIPPTGA